MENNKDQKMKVTCYKNPDYKIYQNKYPMLIDYEPEMFILSTYAKEYILEFQKIFQKRASDNLDKKMKPIEKDLNELVKRYRAEQKLYFINEIDLTTQGKFPQRLVNTQIAILPGMVRLKSPKIAEQISMKGRSYTYEEEKKVNIKKGCNKC